MRFLDAYDDIGDWSEVKIDIIRKYAQAYSTIMTATDKPKLYHIYIDAFAGPGFHWSRNTREFVQGSPLEALSVQPPFREFHFIEIDSKKIESLREIAGSRENVYIWEGDCNQLLPMEVFPRVRYEDYKRALCLLDPYGLHLNWEVIEKAGKMGTVDMFLNFPVMDMNRNAIWRFPENVPEQGIRRMNAFWGDESWREIAYATQPGLWSEVKLKLSNKQIVEAFRQRLTDKAGFEYVPDPIPMRNRSLRGADIYYLFFASHKPVAAHIVKEIFVNATRGTR